VRKGCLGPWLVAGDFNLIYREEDKNNGNLDRAMMGRFRRWLNDLALKESLFMVANLRGVMGSCLPPWLSLIGRSVQWIGKGYSLIVCYRAPLRKTPIIAL
jgi:hypothetical protein